MRGRIPDPRLYVQKLPINRRAVVTRNITCLPPYIADSRPWYPGPRRPPMGAAVRGKRWDADDVELGATRVAVAEIEGNALAARYTRHVHPGSEGHPTPLSDDEWREASRPHGNEGVRGPACSAPAIAEAGMLAARLGRFLTLDCQ